MLNNLQPLIKSNDSMIECLVSFREQWESVADGKRLIDVQGSVGLILFDLAKILDLSEQERITFLGVKLNAEVQGILSQKVTTC